MNSWEIIHEGGSPKHHPHPHRHHQSLIKRASVVNETGLMGQESLVGAGEGLPPITVMNSLLRMLSDPRVHKGESTISTSMKFY